MASDSGGEPTNSGVQEERRERSGCGHDVWKDLGFDGLGRTSLSRYPLWGHYGRFAKVRATDAATAVERIA